MMTVTNDELGIVTMKAALRLLFVGVLHDAVAGGDVNSVTDWLNRMMEEVPLVHSPKP